MGLTDYTERENLKLMTLEYTNVTEGNFTDEPVVELFCRNARGERVRVDVHDYHPHFYITESEFEEKKDTLLNETTIRYIEVDERLLSEQDILNGAIEPVDGPPRETLDGEKLVRIYTVVPNDVSSLREFFDQHWEADVFFTNRFLVDSGITLGLSIPRGEREVSFDEIEILDSGEEPDVRPRMLTVDIEVWSGGEFPDTQNPDKPVTAITAHDTYDDEYFVGVLHPDAVEQGCGHTWPEEPDWEGPDGIDDDQLIVNTYQREVQLLADFNEFVVEKDPDLLTGWNSSRNDIGSGFDYPYIINRCDRINEWSIQELAYENGGAFVTNRGTPRIGGREMFDMLQAYKKTQIHEKRSYALGYIADQELGYGKEDIESLDGGWLHEPVEFIKYNIRDTQAVVEIEQSKAVLEIYDHIRSITGATYSEIADSNIGIIDLLFLRSAKERGYALPTSERPEVQHYWGAYVFDPVPGKHRNVVYPDLSSLYPNLFRDMNASPETIIGDEDALRKSPYSHEQCHTIYVDPRDENVKDAADEPERKKLYVLKPEVKESFVREIVQDLIDMKYEYKKDEYSDEAYDAVKRITNSVYGVMGDSVSYGAGFRLFDWRIAEAITLAGRDVIKHTADKFEKYVKSNGYSDASIIAGDTDSCVCTVPSADGMEETLDIAHEAAEYVDNTYDGFMKERFNIDDGNMAVEIESYAESALFMDKKKRYAQWVRWDEGDYVDEVEHKGFELVRSDSAEITAEVQKGVLGRILKEDDEKSVVSTYLEDEWNAVLDGETALEELGVPSAINNELMDYGWSIQTVDKEDAPMDLNGELLDEGDEYVKYFTPQPHIRGARYANLSIDGEDISQGDKPLMFYVDRVAPTSGLPETYDYEDEYELNAPRDVPDFNERKMHEIGNRVDAVAVSDVRSLPEDIDIDYEKMADKTIRNAVEPICKVMGWSFDDLTTSGEQTGLSQYM